MENESLKDIAVRISTKDKKIEEGDLIGVINKVADIHRGKKFAFYEAQDIRGEVWVIALEQLQKYEPDRSRGDSILNGVERWLNKVVRNRLANFYRDKYSSVNDKYRQARMNIINSIPIDLVDTSREKRGWGYTHDFVDSLVTEEFGVFVEENLEEALLNTYYDCLNGENVSNYYKTKLRTELVPIIERWYEETEENGGN